MKNRTVFVKELDPYLRRRKLLLSGLDLQTLRGVEIGPLDRPLVKKTDGPVTYIDHTTQPELIRKYDGDTSVNNKEILEVDAVWGDRPLADIIGSDFADYIVASHVVEHVPDFLGWMQEVESVLKPGGELMLVVPDKRMSFDCQRRESTLPVVLDAFIRKARKPQTHQILDCSLGVVESNAWKMFVGDEAPEDYDPIHTIDSAISLARNALLYDAYVDVHCWVFTPKSFARILRDLLVGNLLSLSCSHFTDTSIENNFEFFIKLKKGVDKKLAIKSWFDMEHQATYHVADSAAQRRAARTF